MRWVKAPVLVFVFLAAGFDPPPASVEAVRPFCSKLFRAVLRPDDHFVGTATQDTILAGPGGVEAGVGGGHFGRSEPGDHFGQVVRVDRMSERSRLAEASPVEVVVVPWDYDESCGTLRWGPSAAFLPAGTTGLFIAQLRDERFWVDGLPTFDSFDPTLLAYPNSLREPRPERSEDLNPLSADELFDHLESMPSAREVDEQGWPAVEPFIDSMEADPERLRRFPLGLAYRDLLFRRPNIEARASELRVAGTYRVIAELGTTEQEFILRTSAGPTSVWRDGGEVIGLYFQVFYSADMAGIDSAEWPNRAPMTIATDSIGFDDGVTWSGYLWPGVVPTTGGINLASFMDRWEEAISRRGTNRTFESSLSFVRSPSGELTFSGVWEVGGEATLRMRGVRVSETAKPRRY